MNYKSISLKKMIEELSYYVSKEWDIRDYIESSDTLEFTLMKDDTVRIAIVCNDQFSLWINEKYIDDLYSDMIIDMIKMHLKI